MTGIVLAIHDSMPGILHVLYGITEGGERRSAVSVNCPFAGRVIDYGQLINEPPMDPMPDLAAVNAALADFPDPETGRSAQRLEQIRDVRLDGNKLSLTLALTTWAAPLWEETRAELMKLLRAKLPGAVRDRHRAGRPRAAAGAAGAGRPDEQERHRRRLRQRGRGQEHDRRDAGAGPEARRQQGRPARHRRLWPEHSASAGPGQRAAAGDGRWQGAAGDARRDAGHVDGLSAAAGQGRDLARADAAPVRHAVPARRGLGRPRLPDHRHAAGHGRHRPVALAGAAADRRGDRLHAAGSGPARRGAGDLDVPHGQHSRCWAWSRT